MLKTSVSYYYVSGLLIQKMGYKNITVLALVLYAIRLAGYTLLTSPGVYFNNLFFIETYKKFVRFKEKFSAYKTV